MKLPHSPACVILALIPFACLICVMYIYAVGVPYKDQWELVPVLEKLYEGRFSLGDLSAQYNEHRPFFPLLIMTALARFSRWNISYELAVNVLLGIGIFLVILFQFRKTVGSVDDNKAYWPIPILSLIVFSLPQSENWLWGWQMQMFLNILTVTAGIVLLANYAQRWWGFVLSLLMGIIGTYSFANGLLYWPIGILVLLFTSHQSRKSKKIKTAIWLGVSLVIIWAYTYNYHKPQGHPFLSLFIRYPLEYIKYVLIYLGSPVCRFLIYSGAAFLRVQINVAVFGLFGLIIFCCLFWALIKSGHIKAETLIPYAALSLYSVTSAIITGIARLGFTHSQALSSRYITVANLLWVSNIVLFCLLSKVKNNEFRNNILSIDLSQSRKDEIRRIWNKRILSQTLRTSVMTVIVLFIIFNSFYAIMDFEGRYIRLEAARKELLAPAGDDKLLKYIYPKPEIVRIRRHILEKYKLSVFRQ